MIDVFASWRSESIARRGHRDGTGPEDRRPAARIDAARYVAAGRRSGLLPHDTRCADLPDRAAAGRPPVVEAPGGLFLNETRHVVAHPRSRWPGAVLFDRSAASGHLCEMQPSVRPPTAAAGFQVQSSLRDPAFL